MKRKPSDGWDEHRLLVLSKIEDQGKAMKDLNTKLDTAMETVGGKLDKLLGRVNKLEVKSSVWGAIGGAVILFTTYLFKH